MKHLIKYLTLIKNLFITNFIYKQLIIIIDFIYFLMKNNYYNQIFLMIIILSIFKLKYYYIKDIFDSQLHVYLYNYHTFIYKFQIINFNNIIFHPFGFYWYFLFLIYYHFHFLPLYHF